jgi:hypothetical protein
MATEPHTKFKFQRTYKRSFMPSAALSQHVGSLDENSSDEEFLELICKATMHYARAADKAVHGKNVAITQDQECDVVIIIYDDGSADIIIFC